MSVASAGEKEKRTKIAASACASGVNFVLGLTKLLCGVYTNSIAVISDGVNNFGDVFSSAGAAVGFSVSGKKAGGKFPSGTGRVEYVVTAMMALIVIAVGGVFAWQASERFFYHPVVTFSWVQFGIVAATAAVKAAMAAFFYRAQKRYSSGVLKAMATDSLLDMCITLFTLAGLFLARYISFPADALIGLIVSLVMIAEGIKLLFPAVFRLAGGADEERAKQLERIALQEGAKGARIKLYDCGERRAEAYVTLIFEKEMTEKEVAEIEKAVAARAEENGVFVAFVRGRKEL